MNTDFLNTIDLRSEDLIKLADAIWETPETAFKEFKSMKTLTDFLKNEGFEIQDNIGNIPTAFIASFGSGHPEIGFIAEFDALAGLSQQANVPYPAKDPNMQDGHGCGHHIYGGGAVAAALAVKTYLQQTGKQGTVKVLGCPGEEGGSGKAYMARTGVFSTFGTSIPTAAFPGIGASIRTPEVARLSAISSTRFAMERTRTPASGRSSYRVIVGPRE